MLVLPIGEGAKMAQGSIVKRCPACGNRAKAPCAHKEARYAIVYYVGKRQRWETVGPSRRVAEQRLSATLAEIAAGTHRPPKLIHFAEFAERFLRDYAVLKVRPSTLETYRYLIAGRLSPAFGHLPMTQLTSEAIEGFLAALERDQGLSRKSINNTLILLKTMLKCAKRWGYLKDNPAEGIKRLTLELREMACLTPAEIQVLLRQADEPYRTLFLTAVLTGMRQGELLGLQWGDVDFVQSQIHVRRSVYWRGRKNLKPDEPAWTFVPPKTRYSRRAIVMSSHLAEALELHKINGPVSPWDLVFCTPQGTPFEPSTVLDAHFLPTLARAGVRRVRFHDLRHTYATLLIAQGENIKFIQSQLGHASAQMTLDRYGHLLPNAHHGVARRLDEQVFGSAPANVALRESPPTGANSGNIEQPALAFSDGNGNQ